MLFLIVVGIVAAVVLVVKEVKNDKGRLVNPALLNLDGLGSIVNDMLYISSSSNKRDGSKR